MRSNRPQLNAAKTERISVFAAFSWGREDLVSYKSSTSPTATSSARSRYWLCDAVSCSSRPRNSSRLRHFDQFPRQEDSVDLFRCTEAASFHSPFSVQTCGSVTGDVTCPQSSGLRKCDTGRYSSTSSSVASVSDECSCLTNLLVIEV